MSCKIAHFLRVIFGRLFTEFADFEMERFRIPSAETRNGPRNSDLKNPIPGDNSFLKMMFFQRVLCGFQVIFRKVPGRWGAGMVVFRCGSAVACDVSASAPPSLYPPSLLKGGEVVTGGREREIFERHFSVIKFEI